MTNTWDAFDLKVYGREVSGCHHRAEDIDMQMMRTELGDVSDSCPILHRATFAIVCAFIHLILLVTAVVTPSGDAQLVCIYFAMLSGVIFGGSLLSLWQRVRVRRVSSVTSDR